MGPISEKNDEKVRLVVECFKIHTDIFQTQNSVCYMVSCHQFINLFIYFSGWKKFRPLSLKRSSSSLLETNSLVINPKYEYR